jgi:MOSC domain-containing protein YiiM
MTIKSIRDEDFGDWQVRDLDTGKILDNVEYADDETGLCIIRTRYDRGTILRVLKTGRIKLEDKRAVVEVNDPDQLQEAIEAAKRTLAYLEVLLAERDKLIKAVAKLSM